MPLTANDYILVMTTQDGQGNDFQNRYFFQGASGSFSASDCADAFLTDVWPQIRAIIAVQMTAPVIQVSSRTNPEDFDTVVANEGGAAGGSVLPPFVAASLKWTSTSKAFRPAYKRYGRIPITALASSGNTWDGTFNTLLSALGANLQIPIEGTTGSYQFAVAKRGGLGGAFSDARSVGPYEGSKPSTQNTRKTGVGS